MLLFSENEIQLSVDGLQFKGPSNRKTTWEIWPLER